MNQLPSTGKIEFREDSGELKRGYRFLRGCLRVWFRLFYGPVRVVGAEAGLPASGPVVLIVGHPPSFLDTLVFIVGFDRTIRCLLDPRFIPGAWGRLLGNGLGLIPDDGSEASLEKACRVARQLTGGTLLAFAHLEKSVGEGGARFGARAVRLAVEVDNRLADPAHAGRPAIVPVHVFMPQGPLNSLEVVIHLEPPLRLDSASAERPAGLPWQAEDLLKALDSSFRRNVFRLRPANLRVFLADLEEALRQILESEPVAPTERKPQLDGFALSEFLVEWAEQENRFNPGRLVALASELDSCRNRRRTLSLRELETEACGAWISSRWKRTAVWIETVTGSLVAVFGLLNCFVPFAALRTAGLLRIERPAENPRRWLKRAGIVLTIFAAQVLVCDWLWGRSVAGVYALGVPVAGLYLWRYRWLLVHRARLLAWKVLNPRARSLLEARRRRWLRDLNRARDAFAEVLGVAH